MRRHLFALASLLLSAGGAELVNAAPQCGPELASIGVLVEEEQPHIFPSCSEPPYFEVKWTYRCTRCGRDAGTFESTGTAHGECILGQACPGSYHGLFYTSANSNTMQLRNQVATTAGCRDDDWVSKVVRCMCPTNAECGYGSPIVLSLGDAALELTSLSCGVKFDLDSDGIDEAMAWTRAGADEAFLALDRDGDGLIENGMELFGDHTPQPPTAEPNGFNALALFDLKVNGGNDDGVIDRDDRIYNKLLLWIDRDHDGFSAPEELYRLTELGLLQIELEYRSSSRVDEHGNLLKFWSWARLESPPAERRAWDVFFRVETSEQAGTLSACDS